MFVVACIFASAAQAQWGDLEGQFLFDGAVPTPAKISVNKDVEVCAKHPLVDESLVVDKDSKGIKNVVIYVRSKIDKVHPDYSKAAKKVTYDNLHCRFEPHILVMQTTQTLELKNSDSVGHNANIQPILDTGHNPLLPPSASYDITFGREQRIPVPVSCNIHPWMKGYVLPRSNPYAVTTDKDGKFVIKNLPVGEHEFQIWQEKAGYLEAKSDWKRGRVKITIKAGKNTLGPADGVFKVSPKEFE